MGNQFRKYKIGKILYKKKRGEKLYRAIVEENCLKKYVSLQRHLNAGFNSDYGRIYSCDKWFILTLKLENWKDYPIKVMRSNNIITSIKNSIEFIEIYGGRFSPILYGHENPFEIKTSCAAGPF